jgi:hypothetical protein
MRRVIAAAGVLNGLGLFFALIRRPELAVVLVSIATIAALTVLRHLTRLEER